MPINEFTAYNVTCDLCSIPLTIPNTSLAPRTRQMEIFLTPNSARAAATTANWTLGRHFCACPKCSPLAPPPETLKPAPDPAALQLKPGHPIPS
jgi:hypothetical protein